MVKETLVEQYNRLQKIMKNNEGTEKDAEEAKRLSGELHALAEKFRFMSGALLHQSRINSKKKALLSNQNGGKQNG